MTTKCSHTVSRSSKVSTRARAARSDIDGRKLVLGRAGDSRSDVPGQGGRPSPSPGRRAGRATAPSGCRLGGPQALCDLDRGAPPTGRRDEVPNIMTRERTCAMNQEIIPFPVRPWTLNGISERMLVSHYENDYGNAVRTLNAVRGELVALDDKTPGDRIRSLKREELLAMGSVTLHELYFGNLGGEGNKIPDQVRAMLEEHFGSVAVWRREFVGAAKSLAGGSGWVLLTYSRRQKRLWNQIALDHSQAA